MKGPLSKSDPKMLRYKLSAKVLHGLRGRCFQGRKLTLAQCADTPLVQPRGEATFYPTRG